MLTITTTTPTISQVTKLYQSVGWTTYTQDPDALFEALQRSSWLVTIFNGEQLVGLCRAMTDGWSICYLQDVLVHPNVQGQGLGKRLVQRCLDDHAHVRQVVLLTDDRPEQLGLYRSVGLSCLADLKQHRLNAFLRINGVELA